MVESASGRRPVAIRAAETKLPLHQSQTIVRVKGVGEGDVVLQPEPRLYKRHSLVCTNVIVALRASRPFEILVAHLATGPRWVTKVQVLATAIRPTTQLGQTRVTLVALLGE